MLLHKDLISYFPDYPLSNNNVHICNRTSIEIANVYFKETSKFILEATILEKYDTSVWFDDE